MPNKAVFYSNQSVTYSPDIVAILNNSPEKNYVFIRIRQKFTIM